MWFGLFHVTDSEDGKSHCSAEDVRVLGKKVIATDAYPQDRSVLDISFTDHQLNLGHVRTLSNTTRCPMYSLRAWHSFSPQLFGIEEPGRASATHERGVGVVWLESDL